MKLYLSVNRGMENVNVKQQVNNREAKRNYTTELPKSIKQSQKASLPQKLYTLKSIKPLALLLPAMKTCILFGIHRRFDFVPVKVSRALSRFRFTYFAIL